MKIGITGATGQLGRLVVEKLIEKSEKQNLVGLVRSVEKAADLGIEARTFDYNKADGLSSSLVGIDVLLLISGNEIGHRQKQHENVIQAAREAGVKRIVYTSLLHADTSSLILAAEHLATEEALKASGIAYTILRNGWYTENYTGSVLGALQAGALVGSAGDGKISAATREDFAEAAAVVLIGDEQSNRVYELAGDTAFTLVDLATEISRQTGRDIPYQNLPVSEYAAVLKGVGLPEGLAEAFAGFDLGAANGDLYHSGHELSDLIGRQTTGLTAAVQTALKA